MKTLIILAITIFIIFDPPTAAKVVGVLLQIILLIIMRKQVKK